MLKQTIALLLLFNIAGYTKAQDNTTVINNINRANEILTGAFSEMNYNNSVGELRLLINGTYNHPGHYEAPGVTREYHMTSHILLTEGGGSLVRNDTFSRTNTKIFSTYNIDENKISITEADETINATPYDKEKYLYKSMMLNPNIFLQYVVKNKARSTYTGSSDRHHIISHSNTSGDVYYIYINKETYLLDRIDQPMYDKVEGDYFLTTIYNKYNLRDGYQTPKHIVMYRDSIRVYDMNIEVKNVLPYMDDYSHGMIHKKIGEWLYIIPLIKWNAKAVVADMDDYLIVFEPPAEPDAGYAILSHIKKAFRNKPVRYCVISHHHPDHMGGIRPFIENNSAIVTTKGNKPYIDALATNKHIFSPTVKINKPVKPDYLFITDYPYEIKANKKTVVIHPFNEHSTHTDEYLISYIPQDKVLIEGDLIKTWDLKKRDLLPREEGLVNYLTANNINVDKVVQTWPLENTPHVLDYEAIAPDSEGTLKNTADKLKNIFK